MGVLIIAAIAGALAIWVARPLFGRRLDNSDLLAQQAASALIETKESIYRSLIDLELDRQMGKISSGDFEVLKAQHESDALKIIGELDRLGEQQWTTDSLEMEIAAARRRLNGRR